MSHSLHDSVLLALSVLPNGDAVLSFEDVDGITGQSAVLILSHVVKIERSGGQPGSVSRAVSLDQSGQETHVRFNTHESCCVVRIDLQQMPYSPTPPARFEFSCVGYFLHFIDRSMLHE